MSLRLSLLKFGSFDNANVLFWQNNLIKIWVRMRGEKPKDVSRNVAFDCDWIRPSNIIMRVWTWCCRPMTSFRVSFNTFTALRPRRGSELPPVRVVGVAQRPAHGLLGRGPAGLPHVRLRSARGLQGPQQVVQLRRGVSRWGQRWWENNSKNIKIRVEELYNFFEFTSVAYIYNVNKIL